MEISIGERVPIFSLANVLKPSIPDHYGEIMKILYFFCVAMLIKHPCHLHFIFFKLTSQFNIDTPCIFHLLSAIF